MCLEFFLGAAEHTRWALPLLVVVTDALETLLVMIVCAAGMKIEDCKLKETSVTCLVWCRCALSSILPLCNNCSDCRDYRRLEEVRLGWCRFEGDDDGDNNDTDTSIRV